MTILKLRQANNPESTTKLAYIRELYAIISRQSWTKKNFYKHILT